ncbi:MAG: hypothetical protein WC521_04625 [Bdellovibrionales bacterium]
MSDNDATLPPATPSSTGADPSGLSSVTVGPSWQEQDVLLRDLWSQNKSPQEISTLLGRSIAAIMTRAARLGLPRRSAPGRKPGSRRLPQDGEVRVSSPRPSSNRKQENANDVQTSTRICLMCLRPFPSLGRHNRICSSCKGSSEYESAAALSDINLPA